MTDRNCMSYWLPLLQGVDVKTPKTTLVNTDVDFLRILEGCATQAQQALFKRFCDEIASAVANLGGYPAFLRTGYTSNKHEWSKTCFLNVIDDIKPHVLALAEFSYICDMMGLPTNVWAVREMLQTEPIFVARYDMPLTKERRYFVRDGKVICHHPYWPEDAVKDHFYTKKSSSADFSKPVKYNPPCRDWKKKLAAANAESDAEVAELMTLSTRVSRRISGSWSVDWLWTKNGWYCIDMAVAEQSYHWPGCPQAKQFSKENE